MGRRFVFPLEALMEHRLQIEKEKQRKVAEIHQQAQLIVRQIQETQARIAAENKTLTTEKLTGTLDMLYIAHEKKFVGNLHVKIVLAMQKLAGVEQTLAAARAELLTAAKSRKIIEKLKEKQLAKWRAEQERIDAALMDEIGTQLAVREINRLKDEELLGQSVLEAGDR
jgi:flagellar FliJ protein